MLSSVDLNHKNTLINCFLNNFFAKHLEDINKLLIFATDLQNNNFQLVI